MLHLPATFIPSHARHPSDVAHLFIFCEGALLLHAADRTLPDAAIAHSLDIDETAMLPVGTLDGTDCRAIALPPGAVAPDAYAFFKLRTLFGNIDDTLLAIAGRAAQVLEWSRTHRYCGVCATPMQSINNEYCRKCPACGMTAYPRISPAMMVLVRKGDAILLARNAAFPGARFSALAGFLEPGESAEDAVHREVFEEVGLKVGKLRYFGSQAWPFPHSLMIAFVAEYVSGDITVDRDEIAEAHWFGPGDPLPELPTPLSIAHALITASLP